MPLYNPDLGLISTIQKYSTKDGPGIRNTVFMKGCPLGCLWCSNPELIRPEPDLLYNHDKCVQCGTCVETCPQAALDSRSKRLCHRGPAGLRCLRGMHGGLPRECAGIGR